MNTGNPKEKLMQQCGSPEKNALFYYFYLRAVGFVFSRCGFTAEAKEYCREKGIACSEDEKWLE
jgi:hypothetical protein